MAAGLHVHHAVARALTCQCGSAHLEQPVQQAAAFMSMRRCRVPYLHDSRLQHVTSPW